MSERAIAIEGPGVQPFWTAFTTAPSVQPSPSELDGTVVQTGAGLDDGYADIISTAKMADALPVQPFYTALRVTTASVPMVSLHHGYTWFSCFHIRSGLSLVTANSHAELEITAVDGSTDLNVTVSLAPAASSVALGGVITDVTDLVVGTLATDSNGVDNLTMDFVEFHVVARRKAQASIGALATFDIRLVFFYAGSIFEVYSTAKPMKTTQFFKSSFICHVG